MGNVQKIHFHETLDTNLHRQPFKRMYFGYRTDGVSLNPVLHANIPMSWGLKLCDCTNNEIRLSEAIA